MTAIDILFMSFIAGKFLTELLNSTEFGISFSSRTLMDIPVVYGSLLAARIVAQSREDLWTAVRWFTLPAFFVSAVAILQILRFPGLNEFLVAHVNSSGLEARLDRGWDIRATSTIGHWTALGGYLSALSALVGAVMIRDRSQGRTVRGAGALLGMMFLAQFATLTFATIALNTVVVLTVLYRIRIRVSALVLGVVLGAAAWAGVGSLLTSRVEKQIGQPSTNDSGYGWLPETLSYRLNIWVSESIPAVMDRPAVGWGSGTYGQLGTPWASSHLKWMSPESEWIRTAVEHGVLVLILQISLLWATWRVLVRVRRQISDGSFEPILVFFAGIALASFIHSHLTNRGVPLVLWFIVGIALAVSDHSIRERMTSGLPLEMGGRRSGERP